MRTLLTLLALVPTFALAAPGKADVTGDVKFISEAPVEKIVGTAEATGTLDIDLEAIEGLKATLKVAVASMKTGNEQRDDHLRSPMWLDAAQFPEITFETTAVKVTKPVSGTDVKEAEVEVTGKFSLHGVTTDLTAPATLKWKENKLKITTKFQVKLADYEIKGREGVVGSKVGTTIDLEVSLKGEVK